MCFGNERVCISVMWNVVLLFLRKGGKEMMAMLWTQQIMLGKKKFEEVPRLLKEKVKELLIDSGCEDLAK